MQDTDLSNTDIVVYALFLENGHLHKVHTERIAVRSHKLAPNKFGWKLPEFRSKNWPDKEIARIALMDAAKEKNGALVEGRAGASAAGKDTDGWMLTRAGAIWVRANESRIADSLLIPQPQIRSDDAKRFVRRVMESQLFKDYSKSNQLQKASDGIFTDMIGTSPDASTELISKKFKRLRATAELVNHDRIRKFLDDCAVAFGHLLSE